HRHHQETGFGSRLWIYQGRGRTGILLPPQWHRRRLRRPPGWREGFVRNRVEPEGPARQERPHSLSFDNQKARAARLGLFFVFPLPFRGEGQGEGREKFVPLSPSEERVRARGAKSLFPSPLQRRGSGRGARKVCS